jgi:hypothetical protein
VDNWEGGHLERGFKFSDYLKYNTVVEHDRINLSDSEISAYDHWNADTSNNECGISYEVYWALCNNKHFTM